jgi:hypothetical protein
LLVLVFAETDPPLDPPTECAYVSRLENLPCSKNALTLVLDGG